MKIKDIDLSTDEAIALTRLFNRGNMGNDFVSKPKTVTGLKKKKLIRKVNELTPEGREIGRELSEKNYRENDTRFHQRSATE